jgi:hypothetical protein
VKTATTALIALGLLTAGPQPSRSDSLAYVHVKVHNAGDQPVVLTMHDERDGRTFVVRIGGRGKTSISLQSSQRTETCCGSVSWTSGAGSQHRDDLQDGDVVTVS